MDTKLTRRNLLALLSLPPLASLAPSLASAAPGDNASVFLKVSRIIAASDTLSAGVAQRIEQLLRSRDPKFDDRLAALLKALPDGSDRATTLRGLAPEDLKFALEIAKPWYVGYVGTPSGTILKDDAEFATFLEAQSYQKIVADVPLQSYPTGSAGWWGAVPEGVTAPEMPTEITDWRFHPSGGPDAIVPPSPEWLNYVKGDFADIDAAREARPNSS